MPQSKNDLPERPLGAPATSKSDPVIRQCVLTRDRLAQTEMIRFVLGPDQHVVADIKGKLPGRGAWLRANRETVDEAVQKGAFARAFKTGCKADGQLSDLIERQLADQCIGLIGMAKKAGQVIVGFNQVRAYIRGAEPGWLLEAADGAEDGRNKVHFLAKAIYEDVKVAGALSSAELGMAFGRDSVIHALLEAGRLADSFSLAYRRLIGFRSAPEAGWFYSRRDLM